MKKRILPFGIFSLLIFGLIAFFLLSSDLNKNEEIQITQGGQSIKGAKEYLALIRNNQHTGILNPHDVIKARQQIEELAVYKSGNSVSELDWDELGPDNIGGRTRAIIFDNRDQNANTLYAGAVNGGIFKSTNLGSTWEKVNLSSGTANLNVSCMVQDDDGTIYVGTGEGLSTENYSGLENYGFEGGFVGKGLFKSDGSDNFSLIPGTAPEITGDEFDWAYVNKLALDKNNNRLFAATNNGLQYASLPGLSDWQSNCKYIIDSTIISRTIARDSIIVCDSFEIIEDELVIYGQSEVEVTMTGDDTTNVQTVSSISTAFEEYGNCYDVKISENGWIISTFNGFVYVSENGDPNKFVRRSIYPDNPDNVRQDDINFNTNIIVKNKTNVIIYETTNITNEIVFWHTDYVYYDEVDSKWIGFPSSANYGRLSFAIAPSDQNIVYAMSAKHNAPFKNRLFNIYFSEDNGNNWRIIAPGGTNYLNILGSSWENSSGVSTYYYQGDYNNTLTVYPNNPFRVLAGGVNMWEGQKVSETGYFQWEEKSIGDATLLITGILHPLYCHVDHHTYVFRPGSNNELFAGTDGGLFYIYFDGQFYIFQARNKNYNATQFYSLDISTKPNEFLGGTQDNGTIYVSGEGNSPKKGVDMWRPANLDSKYPEGTDGGYAAVSNTRITITGIEEIDPPSFYSRSDLPQLESHVNQRIRRSETLGYDYSANFFEGYDPEYQAFLIPMLLWENYNNEFSLDSINFKATKDYSSGERIMVRSNNFHHPFTYELPASLSAGDSIMIKDIISAKLFFSIKDEILMTFEAIRFNVNTKWHIISAKSSNGFTDDPSCIAASSDGNYLFVGNMQGKLFRISNINYAYDANTADVSSSGCVIATTELEIFEDNSQVITSVAVDPKDANNILVTLGNYGNTDYVFYSTDALSDSPTFTSVQGNLPQMPVCSAILEMQAATEIAIIGTEEGIWMSDDVSSGDWYDASGNMGKIPVLALKQQTLYKPSFTITFYDPATGEPYYEIYDAIENYGNIYAATHGRGVFKNGTFFTVGTEELPAEDGSTTNINMNIYPNPASENINVSFNQPNSSEVLLHIYDLGGKLVQSKSINNLSKGQQNIQLNINSLNRGTYMLQIIAGRETGTSKLIIY